MADQEKPIVPSNHPSTYKCDIVVALDIGTSYSGYAYSDKREIKRKDINLNEWSGNFSHDKKAKCPTVVMLNEDQSFDSFGYKAEERYAKMVKKKTHLKCHRFRDFKMKLYHEKNITETFKIQDDRKSISLPAIDIFKHAIKALKDHFEQAAWGRGVVFKPEEVLYVLTVPAIWSESAKEFMKKAAIKAGIAECQILLALEPEAAALYCKNLPEYMLTKAFNPGTKYMVLDMGGGTIDIVVHKTMEDGTLAEVYKASGGDWGGTIVDKEFLAFVYNLFKNEQCINQLWEIAPMDALEFERDFEAKKRQITDDDDDDIRLRLPDRLKMFANIELGDQKNESITLAHMYVQNKEFREFFKTARDKIIGIIENIFLEVGNIDFIILVGGFSCSQFLQNEIKSHPGFSSIKFISPKDPDTVVLQGAVSFGYNPRAVTARICRYTYGIRVIRPFDSKIHPESKRIIVDGEENCKDVFNVLVYKDELVKYDEAKTEELYSRHRNKDRKFVSITIELFQTKNAEKGQLTFITDEGFKSIGKIVCKPPENGWPDMVNYTAKTYFGQTNIRIETYETANKAPMKTTFELD